MSVEDDYNALLNGAIDVATDFLGQYSEFPPFAMAMQGEDGELFHIEPDGEEGEEAPSEAVEEAFCIRGRRGGTPGAVAGLQHRKSLRPTSADCSPRGWLGGGAEAQGAGLGGCL